MSSLKFVDRMNEHFLPCRKYAEFTDGNRVNWADEEEACKNEWCISNLDIDDVDFAMVRFFLVNFPMNGEKTKLCAVCLGFYGFSKTLRHLPQNKLLAEGECKYKKLNQHVRMRLDRIVYLFCAKVTFFWSNKFCTLGMACWCAKMVDSELNSVSFQTRIYFPFLFFDKSVSVFLVRFS